MTSCESMEQDADWSLLPEEIVRCEIIPYLGYKRVEIFRCGYSDYVAVSPLDDNPHPWFRLLFYTDSDGTKGMNVSTYNILAYFRYRADLRAGCMDEFRDNNIISLGDELYDNIGKDKQDECMYRLLRYIFNNITIFAERDKEYRKLFDSSFIIPYVYKQN